MPAIESEVGGQAAKRMAVEEVEKKSKNEN